MLTVWKLPAEAVSQVSTALLKSFLDLGSVCVWTEQTGSQQQVSFTKQMDIVLGQRAGLLITFTVLHLMKDNKQYVLLSELTLGS